ncbi:TonB-dependent receptor domain-containing protein [Cephaloticoccus capnophilus]|uniref:TonB-dependent receptor domain-containing protein n=1 Tax=Cephaloticoccus capnophilus TaxID=1548208 RepID=UPI0009ED9320|nr:TonB-dependent receptor [Cephaloticoccus capnophilus]
MSKSTYLVDRLASMSVSAQNCRTVALIAALVVALGLPSAASAQRVPASALLDGLDDDQVVTLAEMEVEAGQLQKHAYQGNMDLVRTENDIQPYSIIGRERIARSGATTVEDLLRQQLTMSTSFASSDNSPGGWTGSSSSFSLRGMGAAQTLVLVNGRRVAGVGSRGTAEGSDQADLNGIPLSAIERIEVLPASASAIYGSGALGGVINVVLRGNYSGNEFNARYETTDDGHASIETYNLTSSFQFEQGRSQLLLSVQSQVTKPLYGYQRDFQVRGRNRELVNNPDALYVPAGRTGNPPAGALVNIRSANGSPLFGPGSSHFTHIPVGYRGWQLDGLQPLIDNQGSYNLDLARGALNGFSGDIVLIGAVRSKSLNLSSSRSMTERFKLFFDGGASESRQRDVSTYYTARVATLAANSTNNPFGQAVRITYPARHIDRETAPDSFSVNRQKRAAVGFELSLPHDWKIVGDYAWSYSYVDRTYRRQYGSPTFAEAVNAGTVDLLRDTTSFETLIDPYSNLPHTTTKAWQGDTTLRAAGPLTAWYAGDITLASGVEHRELRSAGFPDYTTPRPPPTYRRQQIDSLYAEATVPLTSPDLGLRGLHSVDVQLALRHERFDVETAGNKFDTTVPTVGLRWLPVRDLMLRGSWGKGFRAPTYSQLADPTLSTTTSQVNDPRRGGEVSDIYTLGGGNPELQPETSRNSNIGIVWTPEFVRGLRLSADFYKIEKKNNLTSLGAQAILDQEATFPGRVIRDTPVAGDPYGVGEVLQVNTYAMNMLKMETAGVDLGARYWWQSAGAGEFDLGVNATLTDYYREQTAFNTPLVDWVGVPSRNSASPLDARFTASLLWNRQQWSAGWAAQYYDHYRLNPTSTAAILSQGSERVPSQTYHDLFVRYRLGARYRILAGLELTFGAKNIFDKAPPVDMSTSRYYSTLGDPRMRRLYVNLKKTF